MDMATMVMVANTMPMQGASGGISQPRQLSGDQTGFAQILGGLVGENGSATASFESLFGLTAQGGLPEVPLSLSGMSAEDLEALQTGQIPQEILQLLQGLYQGDAEVLQLDTGQGLEQLMQSLQEIMEQNGGQMAGQEALAMLVAQMQQSMPSLAQQATAQQADGTTIQQAMPQTLLAAALMDANASTVQNKANAEPQTQMQTPVATQQAEPMLQVLSQQQATQTSTDSTAMFGQGEQVDVQQAQQPAATSFDAAVRMAKQQMAADGEQPQTLDKLKGEQPLKLDVDALQQKVDAGQYLQNTALAANIQTAQAAEAVELPPQVQLLQQVEMAMAEGQSQLTLTLTPESLGEVTIQLAKAGDGMVLNIITQNPETQSLLAAQVDMLQENLKGMKVEVQAVLTQQQHEMLSQQQADAHARQSQNRETMQGAAYYGDEPLSAEYSAEWPIVQMMAPSTMLNAYV